MTKRTKNKTKNKQVKDTDNVSENSTDDVGEKLTLAAIDAISDEDDVDGDEEMEWNAEALALRNAIADGSFDRILNRAQGNNDEPSTKKGKSSSFQDQVILEDDSSDDDDSAEKQNNTTQSFMKSNVKALQSVTDNLIASKSHLPWPEKFDIVTRTPLPFGTKDEEGVLIDVHDDLKREVIFYNSALEAVHEARKKSEQYKIPFSRPPDFFAEMVKTDDHMAKVKDRLIFESKKIDAFEQRKSNREQKLRAKEAHAHRISEKHKAKRKHMEDVDDWAKNAASNRAGGGRVNDDDDEYLNRMGGGPSKKRQAMNKRYGFGGKKGRFKQNDRKSMNDMSGFNPRGGSGMMGKANSNKRKGKRARDANRSK